MAQATKTASKFGGRPRVRTDEPGRRVHMGIVVAADTKRKIERAAKARGWSISVEAAHRLQSTLDNDKAIGADVRDMSLQMMAAFALAGRRCASEKGLGDEWVGNPDCYRAALTNVLHHLLLALPPGSSPELVKGSVESTLLTWLANIRSGTN